MAVRRPRAASTDRPRNRSAKIGYDYIHSLVDDQSRFAYSEVLPGEKGTTCAAYLLRAAQAFTRAGIPTVERYNRTLTSEWANRHPFTTNTARTAALAPWLERYNNQRRHTRTRRPTTYQPRATNLMTEYEVASRAACRRRLRWRVSVTR